MSILFLKNRKPYLAPYLQVQRPMFDLKTGYASDDSETEPKDRMTD